MKICFLLDDIGQSGGVERLACEMASELILRGHAVTIATFKPANHQPYFPVSDTVEIRHFPVFSAHTIINRFFLKLLQRRFGRPGSDFSGKLRCFRWMRYSRFFRKRRFDLLVAFSLPVYHFAEHLTRTTGIPMLASEHAHPAFYLSAGYAPACLAYGHAAVRAATAITVLLPEFISSYPPAERRKIHQIPNPVHLPAGGSEAIQYSQRRTVVSVGRLAEEKHFEWLIEAFCHVVEDYPDWNLVIYGEGTLREKLQQAINRSTHPEVIRLAGFVDDLREIYEPAALMVTASPMESFSLVTAEALAYGVPCIGFCDCTGVNRLIRPGINGILADAGERPKALAQAIRGLLADTAARTRMHQAAPESVSEYDFSTVMDRWESVMMLAAGIRRQPGEAMA